MYSPHSNADRNASLARLVAFFLHKFLQADSLVVLQASSPLKEYIGSL
jgi:hypothetical protein